MKSSLLPPVSLLLLLALATQHALAQHEDSNDALQALDNAQQQAHEASNSVNEQVNQLKETAANTIQHINTTMTDANNAAEALKPCTAEHCNNRGTCVGTVGAYLCMCNFGFSGKNCQETVCDSARDCNGRGLCLGTTTSLTCLCGLGYGGAHCENKV